MDEQMRLFRAWRFNRATGRIEGLHEIDPECVPYKHCRLIESPEGQLLRIEEYRGDGELPAIKVFGYEEGDGRIKEALDYNPDGSLRLIHRYVYDGDGPMCDRIELDGEGAPRGHVVSTWEGSVEVAETAYSPQETIVTRHEYGYDAAGNVTVERIYNGDGALQGTREIDYDERANVLEKRWHNAEGVLQTRYTHTYDDDDLLLTTVLYGGDEQERGRMAFTYDEVGNPVS